MRVTRFDFALGARGSLSTSFDVNFIIGTIGEWGITRDFLTLFLPCVTRLSFDEKYTFPRQFLSVNESSHSAISLFSLPTSRGKGAPAARPTGNAFIVSPLSNRLSSSLKRASSAIFLSSQTVSPPVPVLRLGSSWSYPFTRSWTGEVAMEGLPR